MNVLLTKAKNKKEQELYAKKTGIHVNIENLGKNTQLIATRVEESISEITPGVWIQKKSIDFKDGNFTNVYDVSWDPKETSITPYIDSTNEPYSLYEFVKKDPSIIAAINGSFFFLTDIAESIPKSLPYDFCVRENKILDLPSGDDPIIYIKNNKIFHKDTNGIGIINIAGSEIKWVGARSDRKNKTGSPAILYNSNCATIVRFREEKTNLQIGVLDQENIYTPKKMGVVDIVINLNKTGELEISQINEYGRTHFYSGLFILQMPKKLNTFKVGDKVNPISLDGLQLKGISSGVSVGKTLTYISAKRYQKGTKRDARSLIGEDKNGKIHLITFDGSKYIPGFNGVSVRDIASIFEPRQYKWSYFLDGGGSSRLIVRKNKKLELYANEFAFTKLKNGKILWNWKTARRIASSISFKIQTN